MPAIGTNGTDWVLLGVLHCPRDLTSACASPNLGHMLPLGDLLTTQEAAERVQRTTRTIRRWVAAGRLVPAYTLPRRNGDHLFHADDVDRAAAGDNDETEQAS